MNIKIDGVNADIQLESEKTVGEVVAAIMAWLYASAYRFSGLVINGKTISLNDMDQYLALSNENVETLDVLTSPLPLLIAESIVKTLCDIEEFGNLAFAEKKIFAPNWEKSPQGSFLREEASELFNMAYTVFSGGDLSAQAVATVFEQRLGEIKNPALQIKNLNTSVLDICTKLEEFPLDVQTGKDAKAALTINVFSTITEKILRICDILIKLGFPITEIIVEGVSFAAYTQEFNKVLNEMLEAYQAHDTVLAGDLAEYELAPRLRLLYEAVLELVESLEVKEANSGC